MLPYCLLAQIVRRLHARIEEACVPVSEAVAYVSDEAAALSLNRYRPWMRLLRNIAAYLIRNYTNTDINIKMT